MKNDAFMKHLLLPIVWILFLAALAGCSGQESNASQTQAQTPPVGEAANPQSAQGNVVAAGAASVIVIHGQIVAVDQDKKLVTLQGPNGKQVTVHVYNPYNLAAAKPGERFVAKFYEIATVQKLPAGESPPTPSLTQGIVSAAPGQTPGAVFGSQYRFAVTVDAVNKSDKAISIKGPDGVVEVVDVANPETLDQVQVGEQIVVTLTDAVVVALDKEAAGS
jgi:hypothetical protein